MIQINIVSGIRGCLKLIAMVRNVDFEEMATVFQGLSAGIACGKFFVIKWQS